VSGWRCASQKLAGRGAAGYACAVFLSSQLRAALRLVLVVPLVLVSACEATVTQGEAGPATSVAGPADSPQTEPAADGGAPRPAPGEAVPDENPALAELGEIPKLSLAQAVHPDSALAGTCPSRKKRDKSLGVLTSPRVPAKGQEMRIWAADLEDESPIALRVEHVGGKQDGEVVELNVDAFAGVPATSLIRFTPTENGKYRVIAGRDGQGGACREFWVSKFAAKGKVPAADLERVWKVRRKWDQAEEALYSAWVAELFRGEPEEDLAWTSLHAITSVVERNLLFNHHAWEDAGEHALELTPDCADLPYFLRAYYSWKRRLPFGFHRCSRGKPGRGPSCFSSWAVNHQPDLKGSWRDGSEPFTGADLLQRFFSRTLAWGVHTGNGRVALANPDNDFYPVRLDRRSLRPGSVYADPYGHILVLTQFVPAKEGRPGVLFAVDGQPDASITRKRFWEGNFLWNPDPKLGGSGFKAFRPFDWTDVEPGDIRWGAGDEAGVSLAAAARGSGSAQEGRLFGSLARAG
jgi:hypothetical protein